MGTNNQELCGLNFIKNILNIFNIFFLLAGLGVLAVALWTLQDKYQYVPLLSSITYPIIVYFLLSAGILVIFVSFMGCCAVLKDNGPKLLCYIYLLLLIFLIEAMVGILAYIYEENIENELQMNLNQTFLESYKIDNEKTFAIDFLQENFKCCGANSFSDWQYSNWYKLNNNHKNKVPDSCCKTISKNCGKRDHPSNINYAGCLEKMAMHMKIHLTILSAVGLGICLLQIFGIIFAFKLYIKWKKYYKTLLLESQGSFL